MWGNVCQTSSGFSLGLSKCTTNENPINVLYSIVQGRIHKSEGNGEWYLLRPIWYKTQWNTVCETTKCDKWERKECTC